MKLTWRDAVRFRAAWPEDWVAWSLRGGLLAAGVYAAVSPMALTYTSLGPLFATIVAALATSFLISAVHSDRPRTMRLVELAALVAFSVHVSGHVFGLYHAIPWYDTVLHAFSGFAMGLCAWGLSYATRWFWDHDEATPFRAFYLVLSTVALAALLLEFLEFGSDRILGTLEQRDPVQDPLTDTMVDLVAGMALGAVAAGVVALLTWWGHREGFDEVTEDPKPAGVPRGRPG